MNYIKMHLLFKNKVNYSYPVRKLKIPANKSFNVDTKIQSSIDLKVYSMIWTNVKSIFYNPPPPDTSSASDHLSAFYSHILW